MKKTRNLKKAAEIGFALTTLAVLVAGCGGGSTAVGTTAAPAPTGLTGSIVKGPVGAARVWANTQNDVDCNAVIANPLNPSVLTNASGVFTFPSASAVAGTGYLVCATGGSDSITGADLTGTVLAAPPTVNPVVTPFTTLVVGQLQASGVNLNKATATDVQNAVAPIATATGLPASAIVPATSADAVKVETQANVVNTLLSSTAKLVAAAAASGTQSTDVYSAAIRGVTAAVTANAGGNLTANLNSTLTNAAVLNTINQASAPAAVKALDAVTVASSVAQSLASTASAVANSGGALATTVLTQNAAVTNLTNLLAGLASKLTASWMNAIRVNPVGVNSYASVVASLQNAANAYVTAAPNASGVTSPTAYQAGTTAANNTLSLLNNAYVSGVVTTAMSGVSAASAAAAASSVQAQIAAAGITGVTVNASGVATAPTAATIASNTLRLSVPTVTASGVTTSVNTPANAPYNVSVTGQLQSAGVTVTVDGNVTLPTTPVSAMVSVADVNGPRRLILSIDQVNVTNVNGVVTVTVPATAKLYALGVNAAGTPFAAVLNNAAQNVFSSTNGVVSINWAGTALQTALTAANAGFTKALTAKGTFQVQVGIQGVKMTKVDAAGVAPADVITGSLTNLSAAAQAAAAQAGFVSTSFSGFGTTIMVTAN